MRFFLILHKSIYLVLLFFGGGGGVLSVLFFQFLYAFKTSSLLASGTRAGGGINN